MINQSYHFELDKASFHILGNLGCWIIFRPFLYTTLSFLTKRTACLYPLVVNHHLDMLTHRGFSAWIVVDGEALPEYLVAVDSGANKVSCWIPSEEGQVCGSL
jgi:hypothetical protein